MENLKSYLTKKGWESDIEKTVRDFQKLKPVAKKLYNSLYWDLYYTVGYSSMGGLGNGVANINEGNSFSEGFGEAYVNNFPMGMAVNLIYPLVFNKLKNTKHYRLYANLFTAAVNLGFLAWHYYAGTENPVQTMVPNTAIGLAMANRHVTETKNLEEKISGENMPSKL